MTERVIEDRRIQVLRDVASRTAEARNEEEVWRVSAETLALNTAPSAPFAFLYAYLPGDRKAYLVSPSAEPDALDPAVVDCTAQNLWGFQAALPGEGIVVELGQRASAAAEHQLARPAGKSSRRADSAARAERRGGFLVFGHPSGPSVR